MVNSSPFYHPWKFDDVVELLGFSVGDLRRPLVRSGCGLELDNDTCSFHFPLFLMQVTKTGPSWGNFNQKFFRELESLAFNPDHLKVSDEKLDEFWSNVFIILNADGEAIIASSLANAMEEARRDYSEFKSVSSFLVFDVGHLYRAMKDFLALRSLSV